MSNAARTYWLSYRGSPIRASVEYINHGGTVAVTEWHHGRPVGRTYALSPAEARRHYREFLDRGYSVGRDGGRS
jgi:poly-gamma-glutamate capsule biosynthesis protein CapA/YwtB (metallophosphatase superfamily)